MNIAQLSAEHGIAGSVEFIEGDGGLTMIRISTPKANALISIHAGQVLSYQPAGQEDLLFLSARAYYQDGKAIKGGVPICWPWFGPDPEGRGRPGHGFVRNRVWNVINTQALTNDAVKVTLGLSDTSETMDIWPHAFRLTQEIVIGDSLNLTLITRNTGADLFSITQGFHTYFNIGDISQTSVLGLQNCPYIDKIDNSIEKKQAGEVTIAAEVDRIYRHVSNTLIIDDKALDRCIQILSQGNKTAVVWNPWEKISKEMADLEDADYRRFICVEATNAANDVIGIAPGEEFRLLADYRVM
ncbi:glucose-6-phosphate 1-epimerase [Nitrosomonas sp. Nm51]|uniref:D-hexose-6-phosphate mutarotase n=1 Tax=Nitrosomonas sp. Nm51 TaxID=133720 RepID=UPI0008C182FF|nr:D-hexose-6-phosphate mutarotase [Nitrosomonas sp. Nm51]SER41824.1 glucose-6-phosphate 1-epimerase [Nitrosomonas sp. Nm51]